jgi:hypothetical protein
MLGSSLGAWKSSLFSPARLLWVKTRFLVCKDRIFGRGGSVPFVTLGSAGEELGGEGSEKDMAGRRMRRKYRWGGRD